MQTDYMFNGKKGSHMPRKQRIEKARFYHIINRGVARANIYLCGDEFFKFLEIVQEASEEFHFNNKNK